jgi:hypothetical protein
MSGPTKPARNALQQAWRAFRQKFQVGYEYTPYLPPSKSQPFATDNEYTWRYPQPHGSAVTPKIPHHRLEDAFNNRRYDRHTRETTLFEGEEEARMFVRERDPNGTVEAPYHSPLQSWLVDPTEFKKVIDKSRAMGTFQFGTQPRKFANGYEHFKFVHDIYGLPEHEYYNPLFGTAGEPWDLKTHDKNKAATEDARINALAARAKVRA